MAHVRATMTEEELEECRNKNRERTRIARATMTEEELEECRNKKRECTRIARATMTEEELEECRNKKRECTRIARATMTEEELEECRNKDRERTRIARATMTEEELEECHNKDRERTRIARATMTEEELEECRNKDRERTRIARATMTEEELDEVRERNNERRRLAQYRANSMGNNEGNEVQHSMFIHDANIPITLSQYHYTEGINPVLKSQYKVEKEELSHLLLSPRARFRSDLNSYTCCQKCYSSLCEMKRLKKPPKYAISNGFAIGHIPESISHNITPLINNLVAPVRAFNFFVSFNGGKEQKITGNFTFFAQDVAHNLGAMQHTTMVNNNPTIFIVLLGSFTTQQLDKIRTQGSYNVETFEKVYRFLHANNQNYHNLPIYEHIPMPRVEQVQLHEEEEACINLLCLSFWRDKLCLSFIIFFNADILL